MATWREVLRSRWFAFALGIGVLGAAEGASAAIARKAPHLLADAPAVSPTAAEMPIELPARAMNAHAQREKGPAPGVCDYPGYEPPCWCEGYSDGKLYPNLVTGRVGCDSTAEYLEDVQAYGQPRFFVQLPRDEDRTLQITTTVE